MTTISAAPSGLARARRRRAAVEFWRQFRRHRAGLLGLGVLLGFVAVAVLAPVLTPSNALSVTEATGEPFQPPSWGDPLGTDNFGRSVLSLVIWGARTSLLVGLVATFLSMAIGTVLGICAGHFGGWTGTVLMRVTDWFLVLPTMVLAIALATVLERGVSTMIVAIGVTAWPTTARLVRAQTLSVEARPYIERAKALGGGHRHVMSRHVLPNVMPLVMAQTTLIVSGSIIAESTMSFLGLGDPTQVTWGGTLQAARDTGAVSSGMWWFLLPPGLAIAVVALAFTLVGRALESVLNPKSRERS
jgi:peptide/nickel transport system permease protein